MAGNRAVAQMLARNGATGASAEEDLGLADLFAEIRPLSAEVQADQAEDSDPPVFRPPPLPTSPRPIPIRSQAAASTTPPPLPTSPRPTPIRGQAAAATTRPPLPTSPRPTPIRSQAAPAGGAAAAAPQPAASHEPGTARTVAEGGFNLQDNLQLAFDHVAAYTPDFADIIGSARSLATTIVGSIGDAIGFVLDMRSLKRTYEHYTEISSYLKQATDPQLVETLKYVTDQKREKGIKKVLALIGGILGFVSLSVPVLVPFALGISAALVLYKVLRKRWKVHKGTLGAKRRKHAEKLLELARTHQSDDVRALATKTLWELGVTPASATVAEVEKKIASS
jgi:hypothetical protein